MESAYQTYRRLYKQYQQLQKSMPDLLNLYKSLNIQLKIIQNINLYEQSPIRKLQKIEQNSLQKVIISLSPIIQQLQQYDFEQLIYGAKQMERLSKTAEKLNQKQFNEQFIKNCFVYEKNRALFSKNFFKNFGTKIVNMGSSLMEIGMQMSQVADSISDTEIQNFIYKKFSGLDENISKYIKVPQEQKQIKTESTKNQQNDNNSIVDNSRHIAFYDSNCNNSINTQQTNQQQVQYQKPISSPKNTLQNNNDNTNSNNNDNTIKKSLNSTQSKSKYNWEDSLFEDNQIENINNKNDDLDKEIQQLDEMLNKLCGNN